MVVSGSDHGILGEIVHSSGVGKILPPRESLIFTVRVQRIGVASNIFFILKKIWSFVRYGRVSYWNFTSEFRNEHSLRNTFLEGAISLIKKIYAKIGCVVFALFKNIC